MSLFARVLSAFVLLFSLLVFSSSPVSAQQQNEIVLSVDFDGTAGFSASDPLDDGAGAHTPGDDLNANNSVVRTNDNIGYRVDWNVNEVDGSVTTLTMVLPEGVTWIADPTTLTGVPAGCSGGSITGQNGRELICITDSEDEGSNGVIFPLARVGSLFDGTPLTVNASIGTGESAPVVSNDVSTIVSAKPGADWSKGNAVRDPDSGDLLYMEPSKVWHDIDDAGTLGQVILYNLILKPAGASKGSEPMVDTVDIVMFDHAFDFPPSVKLATGLVPGGRSECGWYDGIGGLPAPGSQAGTWTCVQDPSTAANGYLTTQITISGHDSAAFPTFENGNPNGNIMLAGQIALFIPQADLDAKSPATIGNSLSGSADPVVTPSTDTELIDIQGTSGAVPEASVENNYSEDVIPTPSGGAGPGRSEDFYIKYTNGPYRELFGESVSGREFRGVDLRLTSQGGSGICVFDGLACPDGTGLPEANGWNGLAQVSRGEVKSLTVMSHTFTSNTPENDSFRDYFHGCVHIDTTHQELIPLPDPFVVQEVTPHSTPTWTRYWNSTDNNTISTSTGSPSSPLVHVIQGGQNNYRYIRSLGSVMDVTTHDPIDYAVEFGAGVVQPGVSVPADGVTCNDADVDPVRGWVDSADVAGLAAFDPNGDGRYEDITHVRVRSLEEHPWSGAFLESILDGRNFSTGVSHQLNLQVRVKDDPAVQVAEQELFAYISHATGMWDDALGEPADAWLNRAFTDDGVDSFDTTDNEFSWDPTAARYSGGADPYARTSHADKVTIVEPRLSIGKSNLDGPSDVNGNGDIIEFEIKTGVLGASIDSIADVAFTDPLTAQYEFVGFTQLPATAGAGCAYDGTQIECTFGTQPGGWSDVVRYQVRLRDAGPNATIANTATMTGNDVNTGEPKDPASSKVNTYTPAPFLEAGIVKFVNPHLGGCFEHPSGTVPADWADDCSVVMQTGGVLFALDNTNEGVIDLTDYRVIDVLPYAGDGSEPASATLIGDGRDPVSDGSLEFVDVIEPGSTVLLSLDPPASISRDPDISETMNTWCDGLTGVVVFGSGSCPAAEADVTAVYLNMGTLAAGETRTAELQLATVDASCGDIYTNTFGARTPDILLPIRSNDVSVVVGYCESEIDIEKATNGVDADEPTGPGMFEDDVVTWTYVVTNTSDTAIVDALVGDSDPAVTPDCDIDGDGTFDGTDLIPFMLPGDQITCQATGIAVVGQYMNDSSVAGVPLVPDFETCGCTADPASWPTDPTAFVNPADPVTGEPVLPEVLEDFDPSHYFAVVDINPAVDIEKATNGEDADDTDGPVVSAGGLVTWTYVVTNTGDAPLMPATVSDDPAQMIVCDASLVDAGGDNIIDVLLPGESVSCTATGEATSGVYENNATVSGPAALPGVGVDCVCDPTDPSSWPTNPAEFVTYVGVDGEPVVVSDSDLSHYHTPVGAIEGVLFFDADGDGVQGPGEEPIGGATIVVTGPDGETYEITTGPDGSYSLDGLPPGEYNLLITLPDGSEFTQVVTVPANGVAEVETPIPPGSQLAATGTSFTSVLLWVAFMTVIAGGVLLLIKKRKATQT